MLNQQISNFIKLSLPTDKIAWQIGANTPNKNNLVNLLKETSKLFSWKSYKWIMLFSPQRFSHIYAFLQREKAIFGSILTYLLCTLAHGSIVWLFPSWNLIGDQPTLEPEPTFFVIANTLFILLLLIAIFCQKIAFFRLISYSTFLLASAALLALLLTPAWIPDTAFIASKLTLSDKLTLLTILASCSAYLLWDIRKRIPFKLAIIKPLTKQNHIDETYILTEQPLYIKPQTDEIRIVEDSISKCTKFNLSESLSKQYITQIEAYFKHEKPYLDPEVSMNKIAIQLHIPLHYLSLILNDKLGYTFSDYVNLHRIAEVKQKLKAQHHLKIESIGYESGFNSKATFNRVFKKHCHQSPSEYQRSAQVRSIQ